MPFIINIELRCSELCRDQRIFCDLPEVFSKYNVLIFL